MKTITWNDKQGSRNRQALAVIVLASGIPHRFLGKSIPGVCAAVETAFEKNGKWSNRTYAVTIQDGSALVAWHQDWDNGLSWPQASWEQARQWLSDKSGIVVDAQAFQAMLRASWDKSAARFDTIEAELRAI